MVVTTKLRQLRLEYGIPLDELAELGGVSNQQISRMELNVVHRTEHREQVAQTALGAVIAARKTALEALEREYLAHCGRLLLPVEVNENEL